MASKKRSPEEGRLVDFGDGEWVEIFHEGEWKLARIRFIIWGERWIRWNDEGERLAGDDNWKTRRASPPEGIMVTTEATGHDEVDPLARR